MSGPIPLYVKVSFLITPAEFREKNRLNERTFKFAKIWEQILTRFIFWYSQLAYADIIFFDFFNNFLGKGKPEVPEELIKFSKLEEHYKKVREVPGIKAWLDKRPETERWPAGFTVYVRRNKIFNCTGDK